MSAGAEARGRAGANGGPTRPLRVGVAGLGTVGAEVVRILVEERALLARRTGCGFDVVAVSARDRSKARGVDLADIRWHDDAVDLARDPEVEVVVELIGGADGVARAVCETALRQGRGVVTANKALLAHAGAELARLAASSGVALAYEASAAGGIPIVKGLREGLAANRIDRVYGILNGTCNYILSEMRSTGRDFAEVLAEAQRLGYAEADPSFDIDGVDTAHKLAVLASLAFNGLVDFGRIHVEGIRRITASDIAYAEELGFRIKLLGLAQRVESGIELRVHPCLLPAGSPVASVEGVYNAVVAVGDHVGQVTMVGRGAGAGPTASAVIADLIDIARGRASPAPGMPTGQLAALTVVGVERRHGPYYVRMNVIDRPGVIAAIAAHMRDNDISVESLIQRGRAPGGGVPLVLTTHAADETAMRRALAAIDGLDTVLEPSCMIRVESL